MIKKTAYIFGLVFIILFLSTCKQIEINNSKLDEDILGNWSFTLLNKSYFQTETNQLVHQETIDSTFILAFSDLGTYYDQRVDFTTDFVPDTLEWKGNWQISQEVNLNLTDTLDISKTYVLSISNNSTITISIDSVFSTKKILNYRNKEYSYNKINFSFRGTVLK